uniref:2-alkenal reductase (NAD(P)(+)) n=1 Tax=Opuntia streptacantha TaxID=393608 RepID=A0A7C9A2L8_OPUST
MEQEEAETNLKILLEFLVCLRKKKLEMLDEIQKDLQYIKEDINAVQKHKLELFNVSDRCMLRSKAANDIARRGVWRPVARPDDCSTPEPITTGNQLEGEGNENAPVWCQALSENDVHVKSESQHLAHSERFMARKRQIQEQFNDLQEYYLHKRRQWAKQAHELEARNLNDEGSSYYHGSLEDFQSVLSTVTRYSQLRVISELRHGDVFHSLNIVSSIEFDRDDELFATAGVSRQIKVFELSSVMNEPAQVHCAVVDIATRSKLSCLSWSKYTKHYIASSDYDGIVTVWDITTRQSVGEYEEHEKRAWSVDFSRTEPSLLLSGGDDCKVKVWCTKQEDSVLSINMNANICSVKFNPGSSMHVAVGSADHHIHYYDLRNVSQPLHVFSGHRKAVSYVKFLSSHELASASTDSTLRLWDVKENLPVRIYRGHMNEKNFVGLTANSEYLSCGSETNEVFVYHKAISKPVARYRFSTSELDEVDEDRGSFISAVCWKSDSPIILAANSQGSIRVLALAP